MLDAVIADVLLHALGPLSASPQSFLIAQQCLEAEAQKQQVSVLLAASIMKTENGKVGLQRANRNGSYDLGPMQINTVHLQDLGRLTGMPQGRVADYLKFDVCANIATGLWLLRRSINQSGDVWKGVAWYHSRTPSAGASYAWKVHASMTGLYARMTPQGRAFAMHASGTLAVPPFAIYRVSQSQVTKAADQPERGSANGLR